MLQKGVCNGEKNNTIHILPDAVTATKRKFDKTYLIKHIC